MTNASISSNGSKRLADRLLYSLATRLVIMTCNEKHCFPPTSIADSSVEKLGHIRVISIDLAYR